MINDKKLVIIMGAPRSGTTWLQAMLSAHETICTHSELWLFSSYTGPMSLSWEQHQKASANKHTIGLPAIWTRDQLIAYQRDFISQVYADVADQSSDATIILDKTPGYTHYVNHINELVPDVHFIHIIRDGRSVVASRLAAQEKWWKTFKADTTQIAQDWIEHVNAGRRAAKYKDRYTEVRYETLLTDGVTQLQHIFNDIGLTITSQAAKEIYDAHTIDKMRDKYTSTDDQRNKITQNGIFITTSDFYRRGEAASWYDDLNTTQRYDIYVKSNALLKSLGYADNDQWWHESVVVRTMLPVILFSARLILEFAHSIRREFKKMDIP